jgi:urocanate hydratase
MSNPIQPAFLETMKEIREVKNLTDFQIAIMNGIPDELQPPNPQGGNRSADPSVLVDEKPSLITHDPSPITHHPSPITHISHAPKRNIEGVLDEYERKLAIKNALRYFPSKHHAELAIEFAAELKAYGRIYMHRFRPTYNMHARPIADYPAQCPQAAAIMLMIQNNLDPSVAKHPHELITYGGNGAVFQNWAQYLLTMQYLSQMTDNQTLVLYSGHPLGLFPSHPDSPRVVVTNGMMIPNHSKKDDWNKYNALGVTQYGQMTAGSFMYIGPQGIVHGTTITLLNAGRLKGFDTLAGKVFVTSGLGGMSGAQALAAVITGCIGVIAEVDDDAIQQRINDGYIQKELVFSTKNASKEAVLDDLIKKIKQLKTTILNKSSHSSKGIALIYHGNIVDLWERFYTEGVDVEIGTDQTSLHNIDDCGYTPVGYTFEEAKQLLMDNKPKFMEEVRSTLRRHVEAINQLTARGMYFFDYGNAFLKEAAEAQADILKSPTEFRYPSYVQDIMGPMCFDYGFGPFRWVCTSGKKEDLDKTDAIATKILRGMLENAVPDIHNQLKDNVLWIENADKNIPIVGSMARILYADADGRVAIAQAFNDAIAKGDISAPIVLGRDHHDVSGTDSPYRETSNIYDGSRFTADMAVQNFVGDAFRGATWVSLHNGGGVGWGEVINGGFGLLLDGSVDAERRLKSMLFWDVNNGIARRSWARNEGAMETIKRAMAANPDLKVTLPNLVDEDILKGIF